MQISIYLKLLSCSIKLSTELYLLRSKDWDLCCKNVDSTLFSSIAGGFFSVKGTKKHPSEVKNKKTRHIPPKDQLMLTLNSHMYLIRILLENTSFIFKICCYLVFKKNHGMLIKFLKNTAMVNLQLKFN